MEDRTDGRGVTGGASPTGLTAVVFDLHSTLVHGGDATTWLEAGWLHTGRAGTAADALDERGAALTTFLDHVWEHARVLDPHSSRDLSPADHRRVWDATVDGFPGLDPELATALYDVLADQWEAYDDAAPTLASLRARGVAVAILSNIGFDLAPVLERTGLGALVDAVVMSWQVGLPKPHEAAFTAALTSIGATPAHTLMVGDSWQDDAGAAAMGIRTLLLPRTPPPVHGLGLVLRMVD